MKIICLAIVALAATLASGRAELLGSSQQDFNATVQGTAGFSYGYYLGADDPNGEFAVAGMTPQTTHWRGAQTGDGTPAHDLFQLHPAGGTLNAAVRRYTVGPTNGEPSVSGEVRIVGRFYDLNDGATDVFIAVDPDGAAGAAGRIFPLPASATDSPAPAPGIRQVRGAGRPVSFDLTTTVAPGATIDFGALALGSYFADSTGFVASIVTGDTAVPTDLVANSISSLVFPVFADSDVRGNAFTTATDGVIGGTDETSFDTNPGTGFPYQHAGLLYLENAASGKATRFDSVRIDVTASADFSETPRLYLLRRNSDPNTSNPAADDRYVRLPIAPVRTAANSAGQPSYTFNLSALTAAESTGYGFAVVGAGKGSSGSIAVSEISAVAVRVADAGVIAPQPFWLSHAGNRYAFTLGRGLWTQAEAEAQSSGAHLVAISSAAENQFLVDTFGGSEVLYVGLSKPNAAPVTPASYSWTNGDPLTYQNWLATQPDAFQNADDYVQLNYGGPGLWSNVGDAGYPLPGGNYRGIVELPGLGDNARNFSVPEIAARANIFDAGLAAATQGGVLPPSIDLTGLAGQIISFPQIAGVINTGADWHGPDGAHTAGRSTNLTGVGGISGYLNANNTPGLVGVFLGASQPGSQPPRIDFSANAIGEDFPALAPGLGQVFFIGDGFTTGGVAQEFIIPAGATRLFFGIPDGNNGTLYHGTPIGYGDNSGSVSLRAVVTASATPVIVSTDFPANGGTLGAAGGTGSGYTWTISSGQLPPHLALATSGAVTVGGVRVNGTFTFTVRAADGSGAFVEKQFTVVVADPIAPGGGLVAWWPGDNAVNEIISGRHGSLRNVAFDNVSLANGAAFGPGKVGRAFAFDGTNDHLFVADHDSLDLTGDLTIEAWVEATATSGERTIVSKRSSDNLNVTYVLFTRDGILRFAARNAGGSFAEVSGGVSVPAGWSHVAVTIGGSTLRMFINGTSVLETTTFDATRPATAGPLTIGGAVTEAFPTSSPDGPWAGRIDELSLYNRALTNAEIAAIHSAGASGKLRADNARDFSATENPTGVWSYRELSGSASLGSSNPNDPAYNPANAALMTNHAVGLEGRLDFWSAEASLTRSKVSDFFHVPSGGSQYDWLPGGFGWGPGSGSQRPVVRWTAPAAGRYAVSVNFTNTDTTPTSSSVHVRRGAAVLFDGIVSTYRGDGLSSTNTITATAGDTVDFILGTNGDWRYDSAQIAASVVSLGSLPEIVQTEFPEDTAQFGIPWKLTAAGGTAPYAFAVVSGSLPQTIVLEADGDITGELTQTGRTTFTVEVTDAAGLKAQRVFTVVVAEEFAAPRGLTNWFPAELHSHDVIAGEFGIAVGSDFNGPFGAGKSGRGFVFDGVDDSVEVYSSDAVNKVPLTIEAWIKPELRPGSAAEFRPTNILSGDRAYYGGHGIGANVFADGSHLWIEVQHTDPAQAFRRVPGNHFSAGQWAHVALVLTPGNAKTYVNGALVDDFNFTQGTMDANDMFRIGRHNEDSGYPAGHRFFKGAIDEISIYDRALSAAEIVGIVNADAFGKTRDDAARDFFTQSNDAGQLWQYGQLSAGTTPASSSFARYATVGSENTLRYWRNGAAPDPNVIKNRGDQPYFHWRAGELSVHPGPGGQYSAVRWTAPTAGSYAVFSHFQRMNTQTGSVTVHARQNGAVLQDSQTGLPALESHTLNGPGSRTSFAATITAAAGDTVDFIVGVGDGYGFDATGLAPSVVKLNGGPSITSTEFPAPAEGSLVVEGALTADGDGPFTFAVTGGALPPGLTLRPDGGVRGTLTANGTFTFTVTATDANGLTSSQQFTMIVANVPPPPPFHPAESLSFKANGKLTKLVAGKPTPVVRQDSKFRFEVTQTGDVFAAGLRVRVQFSATPQDEASWQTLPDGSLSRKKDGDTKWFLDTLRMPAGDNLYFRVRTSADGYSPGIGPVAAGPTTLALLGPISITATPVIEQTITARSDSDPTGRKVFPSEEIYYTITSKNIGSAPATGLVQSLKIPKNTEFENIFNPNSSGGVFSSLPKGKSGDDITSVTWTYAAPLAPGASVRNTVGVELLNPKGEASHPPFGTIIRADGLAVTYAGKVAAAETADRVVLTEITPPISLTLETLTPIAVRGGAILFKMIARNDASYDAKECKAFYRLPNGARVLFVGKSSNGGLKFDDFSDAATQVPQESLNPTLTPYQFGAPQVLRWNLGTIPGTDTSGSASSRTRELFFVLEVKHDVLPTQLINGVHVTTALSSVGWNLFYTPPSGGSIPVYAKGGPEVRTLISAEDVVDPPILGLEKSAVADTIFRSHKVEGDEAFAGDVTGIIQGNLVSYRLHYKNSGNTAAQRCSVLERIADGLAFAGDVFISRTGDPADEQPIPFNAYRFYDKAGKLISGEPYFDGNSNGKYDFGEVFTDYTGDKKFTARGDLKKSAWVRFDVGVIEPGTAGYVAYRCAATAAPGKLIKSDGYTLVSESLNEPITGTPRATYSRIVKGLSFEVQSRQSTTSAAPFDNPERPQDSEIITEAEVKNTGDLRASEATIAIDVPLGLVVQSTAMLDDAGALTSVQATTKARTLTWKTAIPAGEKRVVRILSRVLPSAQLPAVLQKLNSAFVFAPPQVEGKYSPTSALRSAGFSLLSVTEKPVTAEAQGTDTNVLLRQPNRAEVWAFKSAPLTQESRKNIRYLFVVGNSGNIEARNVEAAFYIPPGTNFVGATAGHTRKGEVIRWKLGSVGAHGAVGLSIDLNIAHLENGMVKDNSFVVTAENAPEVVPFVTRTSVRQRPFHAGLWEWFANAIGALGINVKGPGGAALQDELGELSDTSRTHTTRGANIIWNKNGVGVIPNGDGQVVAIGPVGAFTGGTVLTSGQGTTVVGGTGATIEARGVGKLTGSLLLALVEEARTRNDKQAPSLFVCGNGRLVYYSGNQLINNDTNAVVGGITAKAGPGLVAAGGMNLVAAGGGNIVAAGGLNVNQLVAAGGGNMVAAGGLNLVAAGGGNLTGTAGGNIVAAGGMNLVAAGGGNILSHNGGTMVAAGGLNNAQGLVAAGGLNLVSRLVGNDGASLVGLDAATLVGNDGASLIGMDGASLVGNDGASLVGQDGGSLVAAGAGN